VGTDGLENPQRNGAKFLANVIAGACSSKTERQLPPE